MAVNKISILWLSLVAVFGRSQQPPLAVQDIIGRSSQATHGDLEKAPGFDFCMLDRSGTDERTYLVRMIAGSPYNRLVAINGKTLSTEDEQKEAENSKLLFCSCKRAPRRRMSGDGPSTIKRDTGIYNYSKNSS